MNKIILLVLFISFIALPVMAQESLSGNQKKIRPWIVDVPQDFSVRAIAGGIAPGTSVNKIEIDSKGNAVYWSLVQGNGENSQYKKIKTFSLDKSFLAYIYRVILKNNFFGLQKDYTAKDILDGTFAVLSVTLDKRAYTVSTRNMAVEAFDNIMSALNSVLPEENKVLYNEILQ